MARGLNPRRWGEARKAVLARDGHQCAAVEHYGDVVLRCPTRTGLNVHHKTRPEDGGAAYDPANLLTLCRSHHTRLHLTLPEHREKRTRRRRGRPNDGAYRYSNAA